MSLNRVGKIYGDLAAQALGLDDVAFVTAEMDVESATVSVSAPVAGKVRGLPFQPLVEDSLSLLAVDGSEYVVGTDYEETQTGFLNLLIPAGEALTATFFFYTEGPIAPSIPAAPLPGESHLPPEQKAPPQDPGGSRGSGIRYSTMLKMGMS